MSALAAEMLDDLAAARKAGDSDKIVELRRELLTLNAEMAEDAGNHDRARQIRESRDEWLLKIGVTL